MHIIQELSREMVIILWERYQIKEPQVASNTSMNNRLTRMVCNHTSIHNRRMQVLTNNSRVLIC